MIDRMRHVVFSPLKRDPYRGGGYVVEANHLSGEYGLPEPRYGETMRFPSWKAALAAVDIPPDATVRVLWSELFPGRPSI